MIFKNLKTLCLPVFCAWLSGCGLATDPRLSADALMFSQSVEALSLLVEKQYDAVENANYFTLKDNMELQLVLGGMPDLSIAPLFSENQRSARTGALKMLRLYGFRLNQTLAGDTVPNLVATGVDAVHGIRDVAVGDFNLSRSLSGFQTRRIAASLSGFARLLFLPKRNQALARVSAETHGYILQIALLFYLDFGAPADQTDKCRFSAPTTFNDLVLSEPSLCRGGLRGLFKRSIDADVVTWKQRLQLLPTTDEDSFSKRRAVVSRALDIQKVGNQQDALMKEIQSSFVAMVKAHESLVAQMAHHEVRSQDGGGERPFAVDTHPVARFSNIISRLQGKERIQKEQFDLLVKG